MTAMGTGKEEGRELGKELETTAFVVICLSPRVAIMFLETLKWPSVWCSTCWLLGSTGQVSFPFLGSEGSHIGQRQDRNLQKGKKRLEKMCRK